MVAQNTLLSPTGNAIWVRHSITSTQIAKSIFFLKMIYFVYTCATCSELPSDIRTMVPPAVVDVGLVVNHYVQGGPHTVTSRERGVSKIKKSKKEI